MDVGAKVAEAAGAYGSPSEHLRDELRWLALLLLREVARFRASHPDPADGFQGIYIGDAEVDRLLRDLLGDPRPGAAAGEDLESERLASEADAVRASIAARLAAGDRASPLQRLASLFGLDAVDRAVLLVACAPDLDRRFETLYAYLQDDVTRRRPSPGLALALLAASPAEQWPLRPRLAPGAPLLDGGLVRVEGDAPFLSRTLRCDDRVLDELLDAPDRLDVRLRGLAELRQPAARLWRLPPSQQLEERVEALGQLWRRRSPRPARPIHPVAAIEGARGSGLEDAARAVAAQLGRPLLDVDLERLIAGAVPAAEAVATLLREAVLHDAVILLGDAQELARQDDRAREARLAIRSLLGDAPVPIALMAARAAELPRLVPDLPLVRLEVPEPALGERRRLWSEALEREGLRAERAEVDRVSRTFALPPGRIERAAAGAGHLAGLRGAGRSVEAEDLRRAARAESHQGLGELAQKIEPLYEWEDIVLPGATLRQLREIAAAVEHRSVVFDEWAFGRKVSRGKGLNVLFSGASGTGKTMAAEVIGRELGLDLFRIDLATVVSKYIGETEKNLKRIFEEAEASNAILFFDEADALFGKRSEVRDSHDRYANIEISQLLQLMEGYEAGGMAILATNLSKNLDDAFARRMSHAVEFPFPDAGLRERIWERVFPAEAPLAEEVDFAFLAKQFELAGGSIRGAALGAAALAAADGGAIGMPHLAIAVAREYQKLGKLPSQGEFGPWYRLVLEQLAGGG